MTKQRTRRHRSAPQPATLHKPRGYFHQRVEKVGPAHFGIACIDCHKDYSQWMLTDFFGTFLISPRRLDHNRHALDEALAALRHAVRKHHLKDLLSCRTL
jgi:hypothetical protein